MTPPPVSARLVRASDLGRGAHGVVASLDGPPDAVERLSALGLAPGAALRVVRGGSPMTVAVGESRFALGTAWADAILVVRT